MAGIPNVTAVRTISLFGLSDVKVQFTYAFTYDEAQQWVINRLSQLSPLPNGATPQISPESPIGEIYRYRVVGPPGLQRHRSEDHPGLDPRAPVQGGAGGHRRHRVGRQDQDLRDHRRSRSSAGAGDHPAADAAGAQQQQHQCRRPDRQFRAAGRDRPRRRPDPLDGSDPRHDDNRGQRRPSADRRRRHHHRRPSAAPRHRRPGRRRRHRPGNRADAARRTEHADDPPRGGRGRKDQRFGHPATGRAD